MPDYDLPHIDISSLASTERYKSKNPGPRTRYDRTRDDHGRRIRDELAAAFEAVDRARPAPEELPESTSSSGGTYIEIELHPKAGHVDVDRKREKTRQGAERELSNGARTVILHVPDKSREVLVAVVEEYRVGELTEEGYPPRRGRIEPIEAIRRAELEAFWRDDPDALPTDGQMRIWWGVWCWPDMVDDIRTLAAGLGATVAPKDRWMTFPEAKVLPIHARRSEIELMIRLGQGGIAELGRATDDPAVIMEELEPHHHDLVGDLAKRIIWPGTGVPAVCVLDTGANRGHPLLEPALAEGDMQAIDDDWEVDDHDRRGHGTGMAGLSLHGDLTASLGDGSEPVLRHRLETVKVLPPDGWPANEPSNYGAVTIQAVALAEIADPGRARIYCMAISNDGTTGDRPTQWSAAIDQITAGVDAQGSEEPPRRLFVQSIGNIPPAEAWDDIADPDAHPGEDPSQAWNALTVGGVTFRNQITETNYTEWTARAGVGEPSPYGRNSIGWPDSSTPVKPDVVFEAGNRATSPHDEPVLDGLASLSVLTTGKGGSGDVLAPFYATSAATAQAARMAAHITAEHPGYWPETVRALMAHSAQWTPAMVKALSSEAGVTGRKKLRRRFGYGMPDLGRALASASSDLALVAQAEIQPFRKTEGNIGFGDAHYYPLPWPAETLQELENTEVRLKIALSYFVEPNPSTAAVLDAARYRSFGLRFDLKRSGETVGNFKRRRNAAIEGPGQRSDPDDQRWLFGPKAVAAGSLHVDVWSGPAVDLATRNHLCVYPVTGWWRERPGLKQVERLARYALVVGLEAAEVDLHTPISANIKNLLEAATETKT